MSYGMQLMQRPAVGLDTDHLTPHAEPGLVERYQRVREQQVEGNRPEGWQAGQGSLSSSLAINMGISRRADADLSPCLGLRAICQGTLCRALPVGLWQTIEEALEHGDLASIVPDGVV